ncbi:hypothetical protein Tco_0816580 [Tanacetum coccineum]
MGFEELVFKQEHKEDWLTNHPKGILVGAVIGGVGMAVNSLHRGPTPPTSGGSPHYPESDQDNPIVTAAFVSSFKPIGNPFHKDLDKVAPSFYVSNFPDSIDSKGLWNVCAPYGRLVDVFIANKRSKRVDDLDDTLKDLAADKQEEEVSTLNSKISNDKVEKQVHSEDINVSHSQPSIEECSSDLSCPPVREENECLGSIFSRADADIFNHFICRTALIDLPMGGHAFTWMNKASTKLSKLDRFLITEDILESLADILFLRDGFDEVVTNELSYLGQSGDGTKLSSHVKLKLLKTKIKEWYVHSKNNDRAHKQDVVNALRLLEEKIEMGNASPKERESCIKLLQEIDKLDYLEPKI